MELRRFFELPALDRKFLDNYGLPWETVIDGSPWLLVHQFPTDSGYNHEKVTLAIRIETGYPATPLDMAYFYPPLARRDGRPIGATQCMQPLDGKEYQRWSRHRTPNNPWKVGEDSVETHVLLVEQWLAKEFEKCPA